ncbi:MAG: peptidoglycan recognition protein family protein [Bacteroidetes bacterium]|nr:peptidoglycan recognition protein family protein [Bacteroidota bacterium]MBU2583819.1 peptidoglycan recognition protein family protein [Bacteroidota bacterium]
MLRKIVSLSIFIAMFIFNSCSGPKLLSWDELEIIPRAVWNANDPKEYKTHTIERITIHHEGTFFHQDSSALRRIKNVQTWGMGPDRKWIDIPYHFLIDGKGNIIEGRNPLTVGETNTSYDPTGHVLISVIGQYHRKQVLRVEQLNSIIQLAANLCIKFNLSPDSIKGHRDFCKPNETSCPGDDIYRYIQDGTITKSVKKLLLNKLN